MSENKNKAIIHHIGLKNFKGYQEASIPLAPITLFFGPNSAGKSTVFQVLYLLKQTLQFAPEDVPLLFTYDRDGTGHNAGYVNLGSYEDVVFDHDTNLKIGISINGLEMTFSKEQGEVMVDQVILPEEYSDSFFKQNTKETPILRGEKGHFVQAKSPFYKSAYIRLHDHRDDVVWAINQERIVRTMNALEESLVHDNLFKELMFVMEEIHTTGLAGKNMEDFHLGEGFDLREKWDEEKLATRRKEAQEYDREHTCAVDPFDPGVRLRGALDPKFIQNMDLRRSFDKWFKIISEIQATREYQDEFQKQQKSYGKPIIDLFSHDFSAQELWELLEIQIDRLGVTFKNFIPDEYDNFVQRGDVTIEFLLQRLSVCGIWAFYNQLQLARSGSIELPNISFHMSYSYCGEINARDKHGSIIMPLLLRGEGFEGECKTSDMNSLFGRKGIKQWVANNHLRDDLLEKFKPVGPVRLSPRRLYWSSKSTVGNVGFMGEWVGDVLLDEGCKAEVNKWLVRLTGYKVEREDVGDILPGAYVLKVRDTRRKRETADKKSEYVKITDVGFGISQVLPLVAQLVAAKNSVITIEQPESQIHPALQADFADLVIESMTKNGNQVLVETHSEHIILRLLRRLRESAKNPSKESAIKAEDVGVIYVSPSPNGSVVQKMEISDDGQILSPWPGGFFPERVKELFGEE